MKRNYDINKLSFAVYRHILLVLFLFSCILINAQTKRAFLVGVSDYPQNSDSLWDNIHGTNDVDMISKTLKAQAFKVTTLINNVATAVKIRKGLKAFANSCKSGDIVYLHFSCHGQPFEDNNGDEEDGWDEALVSYDAMKVYQKGKYVGENHITDDV